MAPQSPQTLTGICCFSSRFDTWVENASFCFHKHSSCRVGHENEGLPNCRGYHGTTGPSRDGIPASGPVNWSRSVPSEMRKVLSHPASRDKGLWSRENPGRCNPHGTVRTVGKGQPVALTVSHLLTVIVIGITFKLHVRKLAQIVRGRVYISSEGKCTEYFVFSIIYFALLSMTKALEARRTDVHLYNHSRKYDGND